MKKAHLVESAYAHGLFVDADPDHWACGEPVTDTLPTHCPICMLDARVRLLERRMTANDANDRAWREELRG